MLIDSHCHIHDQETYKFALSHMQKETNLGYTPEELLRRALENGVEKLICIGTSHKDSLLACDFASEHENVFWSYGIHPDEARQIGDSLGLFSGDTCRAPWTDMSSAHRRPMGMHVARPENTQATSQFVGPVAIGEIGLDYHNGTGTRELQFKLLEQMLQLAKDNNLPCVFHVREAFDDFFAVLRNFPEIKRAVIHSFSDSPENLNKCLNEGFYIGVNGLSTFADVPLPPLARTLLETDSPFLAPVPHRGEVDEPAFVKNVANFLAIHYQTTFDEVAKITTENAERLFGI